MLFRWFSTRSSSRSFPVADWQAACQRVALLRSLTEEEAERLGQRAWHFLEHKRITLHPTLETTPFDRPAQLVLAGQACLMTLGWSDFEHADAFSNVHEIVVLPDGFTREVEEMDEFGVVHAFTDTRAGETSYQGPVVVAFTDLMQSGDFTGFNVLIHELAHKLDMGNSIDIDGFPPLPSSITPAEWHGIFTQVWNDLQRCIRQGESPPIDDYAASHPGECFAVCCETFFCDPERFADAYPDLYGLLCRYFNQQPLTRIHHA
ncbi:zinc-dependent peptidase [Vreelandella massiliensis]|uniref:M90 family metallopeptidase n=1 Tax=Vreelandella massiliensis TaxID=1816686 RepID=UPI00096A4AED|nr:M90 family metallopeptidase [Halomonas massiliensis]